MKKINDEPTKNECQKGKYVKFAGNFNIWGVWLSLSRCFSFCVALAKFSDAEKWMTKNGTQW